MISSVKSRRNHYEILGVNPSASDRDIAEAYAARIGRHLQPADKIDPSSHAEARQLIRAYNTLSDPSKRAAYDASLADTAALEPQYRSAEPADSEVAPFIARGSSRARDHQAHDPSFGTSRQLADEVATGSALRRGKKDAVVGVAQGYTLGYFARKHNLSLEQARELMARVGPDRDKLNAAAEQLKAAPGSSPEPEPSPEFVPSPVPELDPAPEASPVLEWSPGPPLGRDYALHEEKRWGSHAEDSRRLPVAAKAGAALLGIGVIAGSALLLGGYFDGTGITPRQSTPSSLTTPTNDPNQAGGAGPQLTIPEQATPQIAQGLNPSALESMAPIEPGSAPTTADMVPNVQSTPPRIAGEEQLTGPAPSGPGRSDDASQTPAQAGANAPMTFEELAPLPPPRTAAQPVVSQALKSPPAAPNVKVLPKWQGGGISGRDNPRGRLQGIVSVQFTVDQSGRATACKTAASSGKPALDSRTCQLVEQRLRFSPALDELGRPIPWTMGATYMWGQKQWRPRRP